MDRAFREEKKYDRQLEVEDGQISRRTKAKKGHINYVTAIFKEEQMLEDAPVLTAEEYNLELKHRINSSWLEKHHKEGVDDFLLQGRELDNSQESNH